MKFVYEYRTSDNAKHSGVVCASDREAAYARLKRDGIKPSRLSEAPGFFNKLFGRGKRWIAIGVLAVIVIVAAFVIRSDSRTIQTFEQSQNVFDAPQRRQIIGDAAVIAEGIRSGWSKVFEREGDRFLASFAVPGTGAAVRSTTEEEIRMVLDAQTPSPDVAADAIEARQVIAIVGGMKNELRRFIADGGTIKQYGRRLVQRQQQEISYYQRAKAEIERARTEKRSRREIVALHERLNVSLRRLGIRPVVWSEGEDDD